MLRISERCVFRKKNSNIILYTCQLFGSQMRKFFIWILAEFSKKNVTTLACVTGGIVCEGKVLVAEPPRAASRFRRSNFVQAVLSATQAMTTSEHYSTNVQTFVAEDSRRGSDNFRRLPNVAVRSSKPWRDLVSFLLRTRTQLLAPFTAGLFCLESDLHFSRNCESGVRREIVLYACDRLYVVSGHVTLWFLLIAPWGTE